MKEIILSIVLIFSIFGAQANVKLCDDHYGTMEDIDNSIDYLSHVTDNIYMFMNVCNAESMKSYANHFYELITVKDSIARQCADDGYVDYRTIELETSVKDTIDSYVVDFSDLQHLPSMSITDDSILSFTNSKSMCIVENIYLFSIEALY